MHATLNGDVGLMFVKLSNAVGGNTTRLRDPNRDHRYFKNLRRSLNRAHGVFGTV